MITIRSENDLDKLNQLQNKKNILIRFMMDGCYWCKKTQGKWDAATEKVGLTPDDAIVELEANFVEHFKESMKHRKLNINLRGYPTIMLIKGDKAIEPKQDISKIVKMFSKKSRRARKLNSTRKHKRDHGLSENYYQLYQ